MEHCIESYKCVYESRTLPNIYRKKKVPPEKPVQIMLSTTNLSDRSSEKVSKSPCGSSDSGIETSESSPLFSKTDLEYLSGISRKRLGNSNILDGRTQDLPEFVKDDHIFVGTEFINTQPKRFYTSLRLSRWLQAKYPINGAVNPGSKAEAEGIREGDVIQTVNDCNVDSATNANAHTLIRESGNNLKLGLLPGASLSRKSQRQAGEMRSVPALDSNKQKEDAKKVVTSEKIQSEPRISAGSQNHLSSPGNADEPSKLGTTLDSRLDRNVRTKKVTFRRSLDSVEIESSVSPNDSRMQEGIYRCVPASISSEEIESGSTPIITKPDDDKDREKLKETGNNKALRRNALQNTTEGISSILSDIESQLRGEETTKGQAQSAQTVLSPPNIPFCCTAHQYQFMTRGFYTLPHMAPAFVPPPLPMYTPPPAYPCQQCTFPQQTYPLIFPTTCQDRFVAPVATTSWLPPQVPSHSIVQMKHRASPVEDVQACGERGMADGGEASQKAATQGGLSIDELSEFLRLLEAVKQDVVEDGSEQSEKSLDQSIEKAEFPEQVEMRQHAELRKFELEEYDNVSLTKEENVVPPKRALPPMYFPKRFLDIIPEEGSDISDFEVRSSRDFSDTLSDVLSGRGSVALESLSGDEDSREFSFCETPKPPHSPNFRRSILSEGDSVEIIHEEDSIRLSQISNCEAGSSFDALEDRSDDENEKTIVEDLKSRPEPVPQPRLSLRQKDATIEDAKPETDLESGKHLCCSSAYNSLKEAFDACCLTNERSYSVDKTTKSGFVRAEPIVVENSDESDAYSIASEPVSEPRSDLPAFANSSDNMLIMSQVGEICQIDRRSLLLTEIPKPVAELSGFSEQSVGIDEKSAVVFHRDNDDVLLPLPVITLLANDYVSQPDGMLGTDRTPEELIGSNQFLRAQSDKDSAELIQDVSKTTNTSERQGTMSFTKLFGFSRDKSKEVKEVEKDKVGFSFSKFLRPSSTASVVSDPIITLSENPGNLVYRYSPEHEMTKDSAISYSSVGLTGSTDVHIPESRMDPVSTPTPNRGVRGVKDKIGAFTRNFLGKEKEDISSPFHNVATVACAVDSPDDAVTTVLDPETPNVAVGTSSIVAELFLPCENKNAGSPCSSKESSPLSLCRIQSSPDLPRRRVLDASLDSLDSRSMTPCTVIEAPIRNENREEQMPEPSRKLVTMGSMKARQNNFALSKSKSFGSPFLPVAPQPVRKQTSFDDMTNRCGSESESTLAASAQNICADPADAHTNVVSELRKFWLQQERSSMLKTPEPKTRWEDAVKIPPPVAKKPRKIRDISPLSKLASDSLAKTPLGSEIIKLVDSTVARYSKETAALSNQKLTNDYSRILLGANNYVDPGARSSSRIEEDIGKDNSPPAVAVLGPDFGRTSDQKDDRMPEPSLPEPVSKAVQFLEPSECKAPKPPPRQSSTEVLKRLRFGAFSPPALRRTHFALQRNASAPSVPVQGYVSPDGYTTDGDWRTRGYDSDHRYFSEFDFSSGDDSPLPPVRPSPPCSDIDEKEFILRTRLCQNFPPPTKPRSSSYNYSKIAHRAPQITRETINHKFEAARSYFEGDGQIYSPIPPAVPPPPVPFDTEAEPINQATPYHSRQASVSSSVTLEGSFYSEEPTSPVFHRRPDLSASQSQLPKSPLPPPRRLPSQNVFFPSNIPSDSSESGSMFGSLPRTPKHEKNRLKATMLSDWLETTKQEMRSSRGSSDSFRSRPVSLEGEEAFRQSMLEEYRSRVADRMDRKQNKVIKISDSTNEHVLRKRGTNELDDFLARLKIRANSFGTSDFAEEEEDKFVSKCDFTIDGAAKLPRYLAEDCDILLEDDGSTVLASPMMSRRSRKGVWSPGQSQSSISETKKSGEKNQEDEPIEPVWTPSRLRSPSLERKEFRPVKLDTKSLPRQRSIDGEKQAVPAQESFAWSGNREEKSQFNQVGSPANPSSCSSVLSRPTAANTPSTPTSHLPRAQNPTVTLLQKARGGQLPRGAAYLETKKEEGSHSYRSSNEPLYTIKREYDSEEEGKRIVELTPKKYSGVGPVTGEGIPLALRNNVEEENKHEWYRRMYDTLHKQPRTGNRFPYRPAGGRGAGNGYVSEPELQNVDYDSDAASSRYGTLDRRRLNSGSRENDAYRNPSPSYKNQPGRIENYTPGRSSVAEKELEQQKQQASHASPRSGRYQPPPNSFTTYALKESGYESDSQVVFRKRHDSELQTPTSDTKESRSLYKEIQKGGEVPLFGLRKQVPEKHVGGHHFEDREITLGYKTAVSSLRTPTEGGPYGDLPGDNADDPAVEAVLRQRQAEHMKRVYEENKQRKYLKELEDIEMRRHGYNILPNQKSPIPLNRYDNFMEDQPRGKSRDRTPEPKVVAKALYSFVPQSPRELALQKGDIVIIRRQIDKNWYEGDHHAAIGIFPVNYVEIIPYDSIRATAHKRQTEGKARVKYNFVAQTPMELSLIKGETVVLTRRVDNNWLEGKIGQRKGIFPAVYVEVIAEPDEATPGPAPVQRTSQQVVASHVLTNGAFRGASQPPQIVRPSSQAQNYSTYGSLPRPGPTRPAASPTPYVSQSVHVETQQDPVMYRAMYAYKPQNEDELELLEGDMVSVVEKCDDGWYVGTSQRTGHFGTFPGNYVERL